MQLKLNDIELTVKSFNIKYADDSNVISFNYKTNDLDQAMNIEETIKSKNLNISFLDKSQKVLDVLKWSRKSISTSTNTTFSFKFRI